MNMEFWTTIYVYVEMTREERRRLPQKDKTPVEKVIRKLPIRFTHCTRKVMYLYKFMVTGCNSIDLGLLLPSRIPSNIESDFKFEIQFVNPLAKKIMNISI
eukprot:UN00278